MSECPNALNMSDLLVAQKANLRKQDFKTKTRNNTYCPFVIVMFRLFRVQAVGFGVAVWHEFTAQSAQVSTLSWHMHTLKKLT